MKKVQEIILKNDTEIIKNHTTEITKLSKYDKILLKGNNIIIKFEGKDPKIIPLMWTKSFFTICKMSRAVPEEIVLFSLYIIEDTVTESEIVSGSERGDKKVKKKIPIPQNFKQSVLDNLIKEGNIIAKKPVIFTKVWKNLYKLLFIFPVFILFAFLIQMIKFKFVIFALVKLINYLLIVLLILTAILGNKKMEKKNIQEWNEINLLIYGMVCICCITILACFSSSLGGKIYDFLSSGRIIIVPFYLVLIFVLGVILYLNIEMKKFYEMYYKEEQSGKLLVEIEE